MPTETVTVGSTFGFHARPAGIIAQAAGAVGTQVTIAVPGGPPVDAGSVLELMTLGVGHGDTVQVAGQDAAAVARIAALVEQDLDA